MFKVKHVNFTLNFLSFSAVRTVKNIYRFRCTQYLNGMSCVENSSSSKENKNDEENLPQTSTDMLDIVGTTSEWNVTNFRRAHSTESIPQNFSSARHWYAGSSCSFAYWNCSGNFQYQQIPWQNDYPYYQPDHYYSYPDNNYYYPNYQPNGFYLGGFPNFVPYSDNNQSNFSQGPFCQSTQKRYYLKKCHSADNVPNEMTLNPKILKLLSKRYWEDVAKKKKSKPGFEFTVMSYNVLAQEYVTEHPYLYKRHNPKTLQWEKRWKNLYEEISKMLPDIMCLQEVQESHIADYYNKLEGLGYKGVFKKKTGARCDGCYIYYKADLLNLVEYETVEFMQPNISVLNRDNIAIIAKFSPKCNPEAQFLVATTHLLYNPKRQDVRLAQTQLLITEVERLSFYRKSGSNRTNRCYLPVIITGDFNSTPDSAVYEYIVKGKLKYDHLSARSLDNSKQVTQGKVLVPQELGITDTSQHASLLQKRNEDGRISRTEEFAIIKLHNSDKNIEKVTVETQGNPEVFSTGTISHLFAFKSVYEHGDLEKNPEGTTFQDEWITVDFIFYSGKCREGQSKDDRLKLLSRYRLPLKDELGAITIPNAVIGSDHLSLIAKFRLKLKHQH